MTPLPSPARVVRSGSAAGSLAWRTDEPGPPWMRGSPVNVIRLADEDVVGRDAHRALRAAGGRLADLRERVEHLRAGSSGFCGGRVNSGDAERAPLGGLPAGRGPSRRPVASPGPTRIWPGRRRNGFSLSRLKATLRGSQRAGSSGMSNTLSDTRVAGKGRCARLRHRHRARTRRRGRPPRLRGRPRRAPAGVRGARRGRRRGGAVDGRARAGARRDRARRRRRRRRAPAAGGRDRRRTAGCARRAAEARMSLSLALTLQGDIAEALAEAERAEPALDGHAARADAGPARDDPAEARAPRRGAGGLPPAAGRVPPRGRRAVGGAAAVQPRRAAGLPRRAGRRRGRLPARRGAARVDRPGARRDPGPPQPRLGRRAPRRRPRRAGAGTTASRPSTASTASRSRCC